MSAAMFHLIAYPVLGYAVLAWFCGRVNAEQGRREPLNEEGVDWGEIETHVRNMAYFQKALLKCAELNLDLHWAAEGNQKLVRMSWDSGAREQRYVFFADGGQKTEAFRAAAKADQSELREALVCEMEWIANYYDWNLRDEPKPPIKPRHLIARFLHFLGRKAASSLLPKLRHFSERCRKSGEKCKIRLARILAKSAEMFGRWFRLISPFDNFFGHILCVWRVARGETEEAGPKDVTAWFLVCGAAVIGFVARLLWVLRHIGTV